MLWRETQSGTVFSSSRITHDAERASGGQNVKLQYLWYQLTDRIVTETQKYARVQRDPAEVVREDEARNCVGIRVGRNEMQSRESFSNGCSLIFACCGSY